MACPAIYDIFRVDSERQLSWFGSACDLHEAIALIELHKLKNAELLMVNALGQRIIFETGPDCQIRSDKQGRLLYTKQDFGPDWVIKQLMG